MTCPRCKCPECRTTELNAVLSRRLARETISDADMDEGFRKAFALMPRYLKRAERLDHNARRFLLPREPGKPLVDPDAEQLAADVVREQVRVG